jgi:PAS domain S-box-containing protein
MPLPTMDLGPEPAPIRILLVAEDRDDFITTRALLNGLRANFELDWLPGFSEARATLGERQHDVWLLDHRLGERDRLEFVRAALADDAPPIIVLTGRGDRDSAQQALVAGAADHLVKSELTAAILERAIRHAIERGRTRAALFARDRQFRALFDCALDAILIADDDGGYEDGNQAALDLLGMTRDELRTKRVHDLAAGADAASVAAHWRRFLADGRDEGEFHLRRSDGQIRIVEFRARANFIPGRHLSVLRDVTERRKAEEMRNRLAAIVESTDEAIDGISLDGTIDYWSPAAERVYGYTAEEILGRSQAMVFPPDRAHELEDILARVRRGESICGYETVRRRKDGSLFDALSTISPTRANGLIIGASAITRDISEKKQLQARLAVADRMASVGTLAAGVAHEINNPLAAVMGNLDHLAEELATLPEDAPAGLAAALEDARAAAERIRNIVKDLKLFSRPDEERRGPVDVHAVLNSSIRMVWNEIRHRARLEKDYAEVPLVEANEARLGQVFMNLIVNAAQAIREGDANRNEIRVRTRRSLEGYALIEVRDTGQGMDAETLKRIFEPFFTTKPVGLGTGLGLPICQRIVHELGGTITVDSSLGQGASFRVTLPPARTSAVHPRRLPAVHPVRPGKILVVDDEPSIGQVVTRILAHDHDVRTLTSAHEALDLITAGERFDVILCDLMMPQMTGQDLYEALGRTAPSQCEAIIFLTGGAFTPAAHNFLETVPNQRVEKPFDAFHLRALVNERIR